MPKIGNVEVSDDVIASLGRPAASTERPGFLSVLGSAAQGTLGQLRYGLPYQAEKLLGTLGANDEAFYQRGLADTAAKAAVNAPASVDDLTSGRAGIGSFITENIAASLPYMVGGLVGGVVGARTGGVRGALAGATMGGIPQFDASNVSRAVEEEGSLSTGAAIRSLATAPVQAASDFLVARYLPGAGHLLGEAAAAQSGGFLRRVATSMVKAGATEAVTEAGQQVGERFAAGLPLTTSDAAAEYVNAAVTAFAVGGTLGAGGGFRRTPAIAKPIEQVTNDDMIADIDGKLDGSLREQQSQEPGLPLEGGQTNEQQMGLPLSQPAPVEELPASALPQLALDPALSTVAPDTQLELGERFRDNLTPMDLPSEGGIQISPELEQKLAALTTPSPTIPLGSQSSIGAMMRAQGENPVAAPDAVELNSPRLFADQSFDDLQTAMRTKGVDETVRTTAAAEIEARRQEAIGAAPLTGDFQTRLDEQKHGLKGGWVQQLTATDPADLLNKVYTEVFDNQNTRSNVAKFAQRVGLLDADLNPTPAAAAIEAQRTQEAQVEAETPAAPAPAPVIAATATAPADPAFAAEWTQLQADAGIKRKRGAKGALDAIGTPPNRQAAEAAVFRALASDKSEVEVSQLDKLARKMGLITDDDAMDITPKGRQAWLSTPEGVTEVATVAAQQGFTGAQQTIFDRGVQAEVAGQGDTQSFTSVPDMAAYEAGKVWARDFAATPTAKTAAQTNAIRERQGARATANPNAVPRAPLTTEQLQQQSLNRVIDSADLRAVSDSDVVALKRMVREGATAEEVDAALAQVQGGQTLFRQTTATAPRLAEKPVRGQPRFREMNTVEAATKTETRTETEAAVRTYGLRNFIQFIRDEGAITAKRAEKLQALLDEGKVDQVASGLKSFDPDGEIGRAAMSEADYARYRRDYWAGKQRNEAEADRAERLRDALGGADAALERAIDGKTFAEALQHMVDNAPSPYLGEVMKQVQALIAKIGDVGGHTFDIKIVKPGDDVPDALADPSTRAYAEITRNPSVATVYLKSVEMGPEAGTNFQLAAHEMLHVATMQAIEYADATDPEGKTQLGAAVRDLNELGAAIAAHLTERVNSTPFAQLSAFEQQLVDGKAGNMLDDVHELVAWGLTNPEFQKYLQGIEYKPKQSVFSRLASLLRGILGLDGKYDNALAELLRASEQILGTEKRELRSAFARNNPEGFGRTTLQQSARAGGENAANRTVTSTNEVTQGISAMADKALEAVGTSRADFGVKFRRIRLGWLSRNHIDRMYAQVAPWLLAHSDAHRQRAAVLGRFSNMGVEAYRNVERLLKSNEKMGKMVSQLMETATVYQLDPDKAFDDHEHLKGDKRIGELRTLHADVVKMKNDLSRGDGAGIKAFNDLRQLNNAQNYARLAAELHKLVASDPELMLGVQGADVNPVDVFMTDEGVSTPAEIANHWEQSLQQQIARALAFVSAKKGQVATGTVTEQAAMNNHLSPIEMQIASIYEALKGMQRAPYFHLGRFGDNFGSATIRQLANGDVDPAAQAHVAAELSKAGFDKVRIASEKAKFSMRFDTKQQTQTFEALMNRLQSEGWLSSDRILAGPRDRSNDFGAVNGLPEVMQKMLQSVDVDPRFIAPEGATAAEKAALEQRKNEFTRLIVDTWMETQPDSSISKVLAKRYTVPGYDEDMMRSFAHRWHVGSLNVANLSVAPKFSRAYADMRAQQQSALDTRDPTDPDLIADLVAEVKQRDARFPVNETADVFDKLRAYSHSYFLGFSPAYGMINMTQLGVTALPELAKQHGFNKSFHAMRRASTTAFAIVKAATAEATKLGSAHYGDLTLTEATLKTAGLTQRQAEFVRHMLATGSIDIGTSARALGQAADQGSHVSNTDRYLKYAGAIGLYTETFSRLVTALAAHELHGGTVQDSAKYATNVVSNSMFDYQNWNTARQLGKQGFAGPITPIVTQFMSYTVQVTEKLYSETIDAIGKQRPNETAEEAKQRKLGARRFMAGHLAAVTALAGTLGLPFAAAFAGVLEKLVDAFDDDDEPFDATAAYRNFLAGVLGKDVAEVVARGLPRSIGFDISARAGEQNLLPFTDLLTDKRGWKEAVESSAGRSLGAVPSMITNVLDGGDRFANGDLLGGLKAIVPVAFKGLTEAYRLNNTGYVDTRGTKLPMTPGATAIMWQLLGFTPSEKAEYSEARGDQQARRGEITRNARVLRNRIVDAVISGDNDTAREGIERAQQFDRDNPAFAIIPSLSSAVQRRRTQTQTAQQTRSPLGVKRTDIAGQQLTGYANVDY